jgi:hypothetical protein
MELCQSVSSVVNVNHQFVKMMGMGAVLCELIGPGCGDGENNISLTIYDAYCMPLWVVDPMVLMMTMDDGCLRNLHGPM